MKTQFGLGLALSVSLMLPLLASAQRAAPVTIPQPVAQVRATSSTAAGKRVANRGTASRSSKSASLKSADDPFGFLGAPPLSIQALLNPFPGFGFNFQSPLLNQDLGIKALIDPATQARLALAERLLRETHFAPGTFLVDGGGSYAVPAGPEQYQEAEGQQVAQQQEQPGSEEVYEPPPVESVEEPVKDEGELTLVLRDGHQLQAEAFTRMNDKIVYISPDGGRRSVALTDIDSDATLRVNQEHGTPLQLPL